MHLWAAFILLLASAAPQARVINIVQPSLGLAFSEAAVIAHAAPVRTALLEQARRSGRLGCAVHCDMVGAVWHRLQPVLAAQRTGRLVKFQLVVVRDPAITAMSFPDGTIVASETFISRLVLGPAELAFVLAHEAAHVLLQHERQGLNAMRALFPSRAQRTPQEVYSEMAFNLFATTDTLQPVFHQVELEADELGLQLAALAGYPPHAQLRLLEHAMARDIGRPSTALTHPGRAKRLASLRRVLPQAQRLWEISWQ